MGQVLINLLFPNPDDLRDLPGGEVLVFEQGDDGLAEGGHLINRYWIKTKNEPGFWIKNSCREGVYPSPPWPTRLRPAAGGDKPRLYVAGIVIAAASSMKNK
jgi:hypothetical protein